MIDFDTWWNSAAADIFRARNEDLDGESVRPVWDAAMLAAAPKPLECAADDGWQPIETGPKNGSVILLGFLPHPRMVDSRRVYEGRWCELQHRWTSVNGFLIFDGASHWSPMPAPPTDKGAPDA